LSTAKEQVISIVGKRGSGKSYTLGVIAEGIALQSDAAHVARRTRPRAALLFDPLDVYWTTRFGVAPSANAEVNHHFEIAEAANLSGLQFNVEAWIPGVNSRRATDPGWFQTLTISVPRLGLEEWELLLGCNTMTDPMGQALAESVRLTGSSGYTLRGRQISAAADFDLDDLQTSIDSTEITSNYHPETLRALKQRLNSLDGTGLFSAIGTSIVDLLAPGRLTVILLARLPQSTRAAIVAVITRMLVEHRSRVAFAEKRIALDPTINEDEKSELLNVVSHGIPRSVVALDEAQIFLAPNVTGPVREVFVRLVKEGRNIGLSAVLATQQPSAIDQRILSQVETFIAHQLVTEADIRAVRDNLKSNLPTSIAFGNRDLEISELLRELCSGQCFVSAADMNTNVRRSIVMSIRPRATVHGGIEL